MKVCFNISKVLLFILNILFVIIGLIILAMGIWIVVDSRSYLETLAYFSRLSSSALELYAGTTFSLATGGVLIGIGAILFLVNIFGTWGVAAGSRSLLIFFATFVAFVFVITIVGIILLFALRGVWEPAVNEAVTKRFSEQYVGTLGAFPVSQYDQYSLALDAIMITFDCCGIHGISDFENEANSAAWVEAGKFYSNNGVNYTTQLAIPPACCQYTNKSFFYDQKYELFQEFMVDKACPIEPPKSFNNASCMETIPQVIERNRVPIIVTTVVVLALELICIGLATLLAVGLKRWEDELYY